MRGLLRRRGYQEVKAPLVLSEELWHTSGHYDNYLENMFFTKLKLRDEKDPSVVHEVAEERPMAVKPMNCPGHLLIYRSRPRSHNEFPLRFAEMGLVHRRELSGVRHGLFRVQAFTQDDAHHFCTPEQIEGEIALLIDFFREVYAAFDLARRAHRAVDAAREEHRQRRDLGARRGRAARRARAQGRRLHAQPGRRRLLRPEDRLPHPRRAQALLAVRHDPARLLDARALRPHLRRRRRPAPHAGDDPPRVLRQHRALPRHPDRALRGRASRSGSRRCRCW